MKSLNNGLVLPKPALENTYRPSQAVTSLLLSQVLWRLSHHDLAQARVLLERSHSYWQLQDIMDD